MAKERACHLAFQWNFRKCLAAQLSLLLLHVGAAAVAGEMEARALRRALLVTQLSTVNSTAASAGGEWSFESLLKNLSWTGNTRAFLENWISDWESRSLEGEAPRSNPRRVLSLWPRRSEGGLDFSRSPFRLLGIVHRPDLATYRNPLGEGRLIFGLYNMRNGVLLPLTVIAEFRVPENGHSAKDWIWMLMEVGKIQNTHIFNDRLRWIVSTWLKPENLLTIRTNELVGTSTWELKEFHLNSRGELVSYPVSKTPLFALNTSPNDGFLRWSSDNREKILIGDYEIPADFRAQAARLPSEDFRWTFAGRMDDELRAGLSLQSCNGCHAAETNSRFVHLAPRQADQESRRSEFLEQDLDRRVRSAQSVLESGANLLDLSIRKIRIH